ncbi:hypothetical protein GGX14DRAFT_394478 [Mycena pura]|uniref:Uncharacterized protein n=1 Tax=Mycena pura TaxID=153505 RepID=A0AAD6VF73_9AGAR|nr:hypothetical protein GGX14DRAFT_394478 [Mycena pura]
MRLPDPRDGVGVGGVVEAAAHVTVDIEPTAAAPAAVSQTPSQRNGGNMHGNHSQAAAHSQKPKVIAANCRQLPPTCHIAAMSQIWAAATTGIAAKLPPHCCPGDATLPPIAASNIWQLTTNCRQLLPTAASIAPLSVLCLTPSVIQMSADMTAWCDEKKFRQLYSRGRSGAWVAPIADGGCLIAPDSVDSSGTQPGGVQLRERLVTKHLKIYTGPHTAAEQGTKLC